MTKNELVKAMEGIDGEAWMDVMFTSDPNAYAVTGAEQFELSDGRIVGVIHVMEDVPLKAV